jgi:HK97 family phage major capsid protein/HK97 family phage prohead protease
VPYIESMKLKNLTRTMSTVGVKIDSDTRTMEFPFSSELPVQRSFGDEILSHENGAADLSRVNDGAPLLWNHDPDKVIGVIESADIQDKRGYAKVRFARNAFAQEIFQDVQDGILRNVSFGYQIDEMDAVDSNSRGTTPKYIATKWSPFEISVVSIPADNSVGIGRDFSETENEVLVNEPKTDNEGIQEMTEQEQKALEAKLRIEAEKSANERVSTISVLGEKLGQKDLARTLIEGGKSIDEARAAFLEKAQGTQKPVVENTAMLDLSERDLKKYSLVRAINASMERDWSKAGFEHEVSKEIAKRMGKETTGFFMPLNVRNAYNASTAGAGGNLVATELLDQDFIQLLRNKMLMMGMGAKILSGLQGNIAIPKQLTSAAAYWVAEGVDVTESEGSFGQVAMSPKTVGARSQMTRQLLMQSSPDIESLVRNDLALVIALAIDSAAISGSGSAGQPKGILNQSGIGSVSMGANGGAFTNVDPLIDLETAVATANADFGSLGYITTPGQVGKLKKLKDANGNYLWNGFRQPLAAAVPGEINGYTVGRTNQMPSNLSKGSGSNLAAMIFGNFNDLVIGQWGPGVEILANPYGAGFNSGSVDIRALTSVDVAVRNPVSFAAITDLA